MLREATPSEAVQSIADRVYDANDLEIDGLISDTICRYSNDWELSVCMNVIDGSDKISAVQVGERHHMETVEFAEGDTLLEQCIRDSAAIAVVESALDEVDGEVVTQTLGF